MMEKVCPNCKYFVPSRVSVERNDWGDCTKPGTHVIMVEGREIGTFTWANSTCGDFEPNID